MGGAFLSSDCVASPPPSFSDIRNVDHIRFDSKCGERAEGPPFFEVWKFPNKWTMYFKACQLQTIKYDMLPYGIRFSIGKKPTKINVVRILPSSFPPPVLTGETPASKWGQRNRPNFPAFPFSLLFRHFLSPNNFRSIYLINRGENEDWFPCFPFPFLLFFHAVGICVPHTTAKGFFLLLRFRFKNVQFLSCQDFPQILAKTTLKKKRGENLRKWKIG